MLTNNSNSTGGLIALGLVSCNWTVPTCIQNFEEFCEKAFTRRIGGNLPLIGRIVDNYNHSKFETAPLQEALQATYSNDQYLFGGRRPLQASMSSLKVAVTATNASNAAVVLANYNRRCDEKCKTHLQSSGIH